MLTATISHEFSYKLRIRGWKMCCEVQPPRCDNVVNLNAQQLKTHEQDLVSNFPLRKKEVSVIPNPFLWS